MCSRLSYTHLVGQVHILGDVLQLFEFEKGLVPRADVVVVPPFVGQRFGVTAYGGRHAVNLSGKVKRVGELFSKHFSKPSVRVRMLVVSKFKTKNVLLAV